VLPALLAGLIGTALMTIAMELLWRRLPADQRYPLPPRELIERTMPGPISRAAGEGTRRGMTLAAHFGFGAAAALLFSSMFRSRSPMLGAGYGVAVWASSYLGWIPALGILRPATGHPPNRNALMIAVHLVWGAGMAWSLAAIEAVAGRRRAR
jgi:uncharacterized membrane protein YagU involved in acid resistance